MTGLKLWTWSAARRGVPRSCAFLAALTLCIAMNGCSIRSLAISSMGNALAASGAGFGADDDPELIRAAAPFSLKLMESLLAEAPAHTGLLGAASSGFTQYAYAFVQQDADALESRDAGAARALRDRARALYHRARDYGLRALEQKHPNFRTQLEADPDAALDRLTREESPHLYWTAVAWTAAISLSKASPMAVSDLRLVDRMINRLKELDPDMDHGALHTFLVSYEMGRPGARDAEARARYHFEQAVRLSGGDKAAPYVALAENVCVGNQDKREFMALLERAAAIDVSRHPEWRLENAIMRRRARWLLTQIDQLFLE